MRPAVRVLAVLAAAAVLAGCSGPSDAGGRVTPAFTNNALRRTGITELARAPAWAERAAVPAFGLFFALDLVLTIAFYCAVVRVLATMKMDNEPYYKEVLKQYPIPGVE